MRSGSEAAKFLQKAGVARALRLQDGQPGAKGGFLDRGRLQFQVAAFGAVGLGYDGHDLEPRRRGQRLEAGASQFRRSHEDDARFQGWKWLPEMASGMARDGDRTPRRGVPAMLD